MNTPMQATAKRPEIDGEFRYPAVVTFGGKQLVKTEFVDWFANDDAAKEGFAAIMREQGHEVLSVTIGDVTVVDCA